LFSPTAVNKFLHTISSAYVLSAIFVLGVSAWFLLKKRNLDLAKRSMVVAATFGLIMSIFMVVTGDESARQIYKVQPMKFASMEGLYYGETNAPLVAIGFFDRTPSPTNPKSKEWAAKIEIPNMLSYMAAMDPHAFVPGIQDLVHGNDAQGIISYYDRIKMGKLAIAALKEFQLAKKAKNDSKAAAALKTFETNYKYFGYGYYNDPHKLIPNVPLTFYSFHTMVGLGFWFMLLFLLALIYATKNKLLQKRWLLYAALWTIPLAYLAQEAGWMVAEFGRQPWVVQDYMPTLTAVSNIDHTSVMITFFLFAVVFTVLLIAEVKIMLNQIKQLKDGGQQ
jgi:cytochrome d ubiquinol oxidase subunit I